LDDRSIHSIYSSLRENIVEHLFVGELLRRLWQLSIYDAEVLKSDFDAGGYDLVLSRGPLVRHIQLKVIRAGGARSHINVNLRLAERASGCVLLIGVDDALNFTSFKWFGSDPGHPLPDIGALPAVKHTKGNAQGVKAPREGHRSVKVKHFKPVNGFDALLTVLLGPLSAEQPISSV
jgi:hypothetical protein